LDIDDELGLGQFPAQALVLAGQRLKVACLGQQGVGFATAFLRFQRGASGSGTLAAPSGQMRGVDAFPAQQRADLAGLRAGVGQCKDAALLDAAVLAPPRHGNYLRIGARAGRGVSSRPPGSFQHLFRRNGLFNLHRGFRLAQHGFGLPSSLIAEGMVSQVKLARGD
jgi:hypothetical protein